jgi:hypothetical protein
MRYRDTSWKLVGFFVALVGALLIASACGSSGSDETRQPETMAGDQARTPGNRTVSIVDKDGDGKPDSAVVDGKELDAAEIGECIELIKNGDSEGFGECLDEVIQDILDEAGVERDGTGGVVVSDGACVVSGGGSIEVNCTNGECTCKVDGQEVDCQQACD